MAKLNTNVASLIQCDYLLSQCVSVDTQYSKITINVNSFEIDVNEGLKGARHITEGLAYTVCLNCLPKFLGIDFTVLQKFSTYLLLWIVGSPWDCFGGFRTIDYMYSTGTHGSKLALYLVEISQFSDLVPQVSHDLLVLLEGGVVPLAFALNDGVANGQAFEVVLVQEAVVVNVVHIPDDELDAVVPRVSHCSVEKKAQ